MIWTPTRRGIALAAATAAALLALSAAALALVKIYSNDFSSSDEAKALRVAGKGCNTAWDKENKRLDVVAKTGPARCRLKVPVQGDSAQPDQAVTVTTKLDKATPKSVAKKTYFAVSIRDGAGGAYEFRVFPALRRAELGRTPDANGFPVQTREKGIGKTGERNVLRIEVSGDVIKTKINKTRFDPVTDDKATDLEGRRIAITMGVEGKSPDPVAGWIDDVSVQVPNP